MTRTLPLILLGILLLAASAAGVSAEDSLGEQLLTSPEEHDRIVKAYLSENPAPRPGVYFFGEHLKVTVSENGTLSIVSVQTCENTETDTMHFIPQVFYTLGLHEVTDIYTVTRTDYTPQGNVEIKLSLSGWFETGPLLPRKAHFINFRPEHIADDFTLVTMTGGESPTAKISGTLYVENKGVLTAYNLLAAWVGKLRFIDTVSYPQITPTEGETGIFWILSEDDNRQISAEMSVWFSFDGKTAPKAHVTDIRGISHQGNYLCTAEYLIEEDAVNGQTQVTGFVTARNVHDSEDAVEYILKAYCTKYGDRDSSTEKRTL